MSFGERLKRARPLQGKLRVVAGVVAEVNAGPAAHLLANPGEVLVLGAGVDHQQVVVRAEAVHEDVVDERALRREQRGVVRLAVGELARRRSW